MKPRSYFLFTLFTLLFLFYPGDSEYFHTFAYNRQVLSKKLQDIDIKIKSVPIIRSSSAPEITAEGTYIVDIPSFTPLYEKSSRQKFFPASTTKVITALVAYDVFDMEDIITVESILTEGQTMGLIIGEKISVENLLYGLLVHSGNDAAYVLADQYGYDKFVELMNKKSQHLNMTDTYFKNPAGLDDADQVTTAYDLSLAARELLKNKFLSKIVSTRDITVSDSQFINFHRLSNVNKLIGQVHGIGGLKTGYTENAGENLVSFYKKGGRQFIVVILKSVDRFNDTKNVVSWIDNNIDYIEL